MPPSPDLRFLHANGLRFGYLQAPGPVAKDAPLMLLLHGFPDSAWGFAPVLPVLATAGWNAVAPFLRGYGPSGVPADGDYRIGTLARDVVALIDTLGARRAVVVGHDWGALAGYAAAALRPDRIHGLVAVSVPHPRRLLLRPSLAQLRRAQYILRFQRRGIERRLAANGLRALKALAQAWSPRLDVQAALAPAWTSLAHEGRLAAALGYYRALPRLLLGQGLPLLLGATPVPALVLHGSDDDCIGPEMFEGQAHLFAGRYEQRCFAGAGHFLQHERPEAFADALLAFGRGLTDAV